MLKPSQIVAELDRHIIGQDAAKRAVAVALRNRWRRQQVEEPLRQEITPKNILMIGPTGVGKTEIARRLARLADAPFIKIEATKFTEVGYVGRDVESIIRDLVEMAVKAAREKAAEGVRHAAWLAAEEKVLDAVVPSSSAVPGGEEGWDDRAPAREASAEQRLRERFRERLRAGEIDEREIDIELAESRPQMEILAPAGMEELTSQLQGMFQNLGGQRRRRRRMKVAEAMRAVADQEALRLVNEEEVKASAVTAVEQNGIVFLDELDKIASRAETSGADVSRQGVQRDLLPLVEGTTVSTRYGMVKTDHILFIASGAFHLAKPSDLIPELQGRLPIRVELNSLSVADFEKILTATDACLLRQYEALLATEGVGLDITAEGVRRIAEIAHRVNERTENIGARRLYTVMEKLLEEVSFAAPEVDSPVIIGAEEVEAALGELSEDQDLARYVL